MSIGIQKTSVIIAIEYHPSATQMTNSGSSMKNMSTRKFSLDCFEISSSQTGFASTAMTEHTTTKVLDVSSSIRSGKNMTNTAVRVKTETR